MVNIFQGHLVRLRAVELTDDEVYYTDDARDTDNGRLTDEIWFPSSREATRRWVEREATRDHANDEFRFQIETLDGQSVGTLNTHTCNPRNGTYMYGLGIFSPFRRKGYASEAIRLTLRYFFHERRYQKVNVEVYSFNAASIRLHERLGFQREGRLRRMIYTNGQLFDSLIYGLTREEFDSDGLAYLPAVPLTTP